MSPAPKARRRRPTISGRAAATAGVLISELRPRDEHRARGLAELHREAHEAGMALGMLAAPTAALEAEYRRTIAALDPQEHLLVIAERDSELVGMAQLVRSESANGHHRAEVRRVAVAERARGRGVGGRLMAAVEELARTRGIALLWLTTHADTPACAFYEAVGFTLLGVMPGYSARPDGSLAAGAFFYRQVA